MITAAACADDAPSMVSQTVSLEDLRRLHENGTDVYPTVVHFVFNAPRRGLDLNEVRALAELLGDVHRRGRFVHVAGTNGKGSVVEKTVAGVMAAHPDWTVGQFNSPHVASVRERIRVNRRPIARNDLVDCFLRVMSAIPLEKLKALGFFAMYTLMALDWFYHGPCKNTRKPYCDLSVIEVGIGGLLDTTNIIERPLVAVVTSVGLDHTELLGETIPEIAEQKAGIYKRGCPAVVGAAGPIQNMLWTHAHAAGALPIVFANLRDGPDFHSMNSSTAACILQLILGRKDAQSVAEVVRETTPAFRCQILRPAELDSANAALSSKCGRSLPRPFAVVFDVGHNPPAMRALGKLVSTRFPGKDLHFLCSLSNHRKLDCFVELREACVATSREQVHCVYSHCNHFRIRKIQSVLEEYKSSPKNAWALAFLDEQPAYEKYLDALVDCYEAAGKTAGVLVICGSFFVMQEAFSYLGLSLDVEDPIEFNEMSFTPEVILTLGDDD